MRGSIELRDWMAVCAIAIGATAGCSPTTSENASDVANGTSVASLEKSESQMGSIWTVTSDIDPMTDVSRSFATTTLEGKNFDVEVVVACGGTGKVAYQFRSFDKAREPIAMRATAANGTLARVLQIRLDGGEPTTYSDDVRSFNNQILFQPYFAKKVSGANDVVIRVPMINGTETYVWNQSDAQLQEVLRPCRDASSPQPVGRPAIGNNETSTTVEGTRPTADCWRPPSGPNINDDPDRPISEQELTEIETATGRPFQQGDSVWGKAEDRCPN